MQMCSSVGQCLTKKVRSSQLDSGTALTVIDYTLRFYRELRRLCESRGISHEISHSDLRTFRQSRTSGTEDGETSDNTSSQSQHGPRPLIVTLNYGSWRTPEYSEYLREYKRDNGDLEDALASDQHETWVANKDEWLSEWTAYLRDRHSQEFLDRSQAEYSQYVEEYERGNDKLAGQHEGDGMVELEEYRALVRTIQPASS